MNYEEIPESSLEYQDASLKRNKSMTKESSVPNFAALDNSAALNSRPASIVIEMDPSIALDSQTTDVWSQENEVLDIWKINFLKANYESNTSI